MHKLFLLITLMAHCFSLSGQATAPAAGYQVCLFLLEDCKITQAYTEKLRALHSTFANDSIQFKGFFPNPISEDSTVQAFLEKHQLPFACTRTGAYAAAKRFGVSITPEVVIYHAGRDSVYYQGRIDNLFERVGQRRQVVTSHELEAALYCILNNKTIPIPRTKAVGCFLP